MLACVPVANGLPHPGGHAGFLDAEQGAAVWRLVGVLDEVPPPREAAGFVAGLISATAATSSLLQLIPGNSRPPSCPAFLRGSMPASGHRSRFGFGRDRVPPAVIGIDA